MPDIVKVTGNVITNNRVVIWKGIVGTFIVFCSACTAAFAAADWSQMSATQQFLVVVGICGAMAKNIESLLANTDTPSSPGQPPTRSEVAEATQIIEKSDEVKANKVPNV